MLAASYETSDFGSHTSVESIGAVLFLGLENIKNVIKNLFTTTQMPDW